MSLLIPTGQAGRPRKAGWTHPELTAGVKRPCYDWLWVPGDGGAWPDLPGDPPTRCTEHSFLVVSPVPDFGDGYPGPNVKLRVGVWEGGNDKGQGKFSEVDVGPSTSVVTIDHDTAGMMSVVPFGVVKPDGSVDRKVPGLDVFAEYHRFLVFHG